MFFTSLLLLGRGYLGAIKYGRSHGKNDFAERFEILARTGQKIHCLNYQKIM